MEKPKFKKGKYLIVVNDRERGRVIKKYIEGRIFEYKGIKFGLAGTSGHYQLTHIESGLLCEIHRYYKLYDFMSDIDNIVEILNKYDIEEIKERYKECEIIE